jgi:polysulfide reductase-like protein
VTITPERKSLAQERLQHDETSTSPDRPLSYYGRPIIKEPVWKKEIPLYLFTGGAAGASALLVFGARVTGNPVLARRAMLVNLATIGVSPVLLIKDLGRPLRFLNMLRVFKITSPMSVGTWIVSASGGASATAGFCELFGVLPRLKVVSEAGAAALAPFLSTYTGALVADSVVPIWHEARKELPFEFAGSAAAAGGGLTAIVTPAWASAPARRLAIAGALLEVGAAQLSERKLGELVAEPYHRGKPGRYAKASKVCGLAGAGLMALAGKKRAGAIAAGTLLAAGSLLQRFAVIEAGRASARDPKYTTLPQRERAAER